MRERADQEDLVDQADRVDRVDRADDGDPGPGKVWATDAEARALASAVRLRILRVCLDRAHTNKEIADRLGLNPASTLHHVRTLVATGFLAAGEERRGTRGAREVPYRATGKSWTIRRRGPQPSGQQAMIEAFVADYAQSGAASRTHAMVRLGLRLTGEELAELEMRLRVLFEEYAAREPSPDGAPYSLFLAVHPDPTREA
jgi:DNA-binding transcriptional ArsR family regulator